MKIAIVAPGQMGHGIGARLRANGVKVTTCLVGRSERSAERARSAGMAEAPDDDALVRGADMFLSIVPPAVAVSTAERIASALARTSSELLYVDCNAIAPSTVAVVGHTVTSAGARFADAAIIGGPPRDGGPNPRIYVSGAETLTCLELAKYGLDVRAIEGENGQASALKMSYGALTKGLMALAGELLTAAQLGGVSEVLTQELRESQPELQQWINVQLPTMPPKAYRWIAEMEEAAKTFQACGLPGATTRGAAEFYTLVAKAIERGSPRHRGANFTMGELVKTLGEACAART